MTDAGNNRGPHDAPAGLVKSPQNLVGGLAILIFAIVCYLQVAGLAGIKGSTFGSGTVPRAFCGVLAFIAALVVVSAFTTRGPKLESFPLRAPFFIMLAIAFFGLTIRGFDLGILQVPGLGLAISGFITVMLAGAAMDDFRIGEGLLFAVLITAFCCFLFPIALGQPIPLYPPFLR